MSRPLIAIDARLVGGTATGDSSYWTGLLHGLAAIDSGFDFLLLSNAAATKEIPESERFRWVRLPHISGRFWSLLTYPLAARRLKASLMHTQYSLSPLVGSRGVTTIHDASVFVEPRWFKPKDRFLLSRSLPVTVRIARQIITVSETSRMEIGRYLPLARGKTFVTPLDAAVGTARIPRDLAKSTVRAKLGVDEPYALTVGTTWPRKNVSLAIRAIDALPDTSRHRILLTGKRGWGALSRSERVVETGYVSRDMLNALYSAADLYLCPSLHEGFGIPLVEAFRCGCPALYSSGGALPETARGTPELQPTFESSAWSRSIAALLGDSSKLESMSERGLETAKGYDWKETARLTLEAYREALS